MKIKKQLAVCLGVAIGLLALTGCSQSQSLRLVNECSFLLDDITQVTISYDEENMKFAESENEELVIREYMTEDKSSYYARTEQKGQEVKISEGKKPLFKKGFIRYIEVYLPASYKENLTITTTNGDIDVSEPELSLNALRVDSTAGVVRIGDAQAQTMYLSSTSGTLDLGCLRADTIRIDTTSGDTVCAMLEGEAAYTTTSGSLCVEAAAGAGSYRAENAGDLEVTYTEVTGDLSFYNKNDDVCVTLPPELEFEFLATTKNGEVSTSFGESISVEGRTAKGTIGECPAVTVTAETRNGNIEVRR